MKLLIRYCIFLFILSGFLSCRPPVEDDYIGPGHEGPVLLDESRRQGRLSINDVDIFNKMAVFVFHGGRDKHKKVRLICRGMEGCLRVCQHLNEKNCRKSTVDEVVNLWLKVMSDYTEWEQALSDLDMIATEPVVSAFLKNADKQNRVLTKLFNFSALADCPRAEDPEKELRTSASGSPPMVSLFLASLSDPLSPSAEEKEQCPTDDGSAGGDPTQPVATAGNPAGGDPAQPVASTGNPAGGDPAQPVATAGNSADGDPTQPVATAGNSADGDPTQPVATAGNPADGDPTQPVASTADPAGGDPTQQVATAGDSAETGAEDTGQQCITPLDSYQDMTITHVAEPAIKKIVDGSQAPFDYLAFHGFIKQCFGHKTRTFSEMSAQIENKDAFDLADQFISDTCGDNAECVRLAYCSISSDLIWKYLPEELQEKGCEYASFSGML